MNNVILTGRLTEDVELRYANNENQTAYCYVNLAVTREFDRKNADFIRCKIFGKNAEILEEYAGKGSLIGIKGRWETGSYKNSKGDTIYTTECTAERIELLGTRKEEPEEEKKPERRKGSRR